jgi:alkanesulfonate monooxygenase SsuD/methylene tetrahydromethanopterin reductase-like flavin-dependent oxidoreductase (luciferase family)
VKIGIGLPNTIAHETDRALMLDWARPADLGRRVHPKSIERAARVADGFLFGTAGSSAMAERGPRLRELIARNGKPDATFAGLAYVGIGDDPKRALDEAAHHVLRYYGTLWTEPKNLIHHGPPAKVAEELAGYEGAVDILVVFPQSPQLDQVEQPAEHLLPAVH